MIAYVRSLRALLVHGKRHGGAPPHALVTRRGKGKRAAAQRLKLVATLAALVRRKKKINSIKMKRKKWQVMNKHNNK